MHAFSKYITSHLNDWTSICFGELLYLLIAESIVGVGTVRNQNWFYLPHHEAIPIKCIQHGKMWVWIIAWSASIQYSWKAGFIQLSAASSTAKHASACIKRIICSRLSKKTTHHGVTLSTLLCVSSEQKINFIKIHLFLTDKYHVDLVTNYFL